MVVSDASIHNIMGGMESTAGVRLHNHRRKLKQRFDIIKKLGQGTYGKVQLGINKETGQEVAIKTIKKAKIETEADLVRIRREIQIMSSVQHPNIIHIYEVFENREKMVLVMEYAAGGELYDFLSERKVLAEEEARRIFRQIATAVYYCHKHKICHRDLKLENILLDEHGNAKIADFGLSNVFDEQRLLNTFCGSPLYASPEIVKGTPYHGPEVDCWSLGVLLYTLVYGAMPFDGSNFKRLVKQISQGDYFEPKKPSPASPLIREMLTVTPSRRADIEKICSHWWVNEGHADSCLDIAEELANQTPVRLDLLLSLAPPPPAVGTDKILVTDDQGQCDSRAIVTDQLRPPRCHSVGSLMELDQSSAERRIREFELQKRRGSGGDAKDAHKRKLEEGISTEDAARGGAKRKECIGRTEQSVNCEQSAVQADNLNRQTSTEENKQSMSAAEEEMDVDMDVGIPEPVCYEISKEIDKSTAVNGETLKNDTPVGLDSTASCKADTVAQKDPTNTTLAGDRTTRKSVKGFTRKSKPSTESVPSNIETKGMEPESEVTHTEEGRNGIETNAEETPAATQGLFAECNKPQEGTDEPPVEPVKRKVKKKGVVNNSKSERTSVENVQNITGEVCVPENSLKAADTESHLDGSSSQKTKEGALKTAVGNKTNESSGVSDKVLKKPLSSSKDSSDSKTCDVPRTAHVGTKKSCGDLTLGKLGSSTDKSSGAEELASPTKNVERRRSKIFETAEKFNIFLSGSDPKSPTTDKPKKVFIPGVKVSDYKQAFERRSSLSSTSLPVPVKNSSSKKAVEQNSKNTLIKNSSSDNGNVCTPKALKDVERSSNAPELSPEFGLNETKQSEDSLGLKHVETLPESSKYNQSSIESSVPQSHDINSGEQSMKHNREGSNEGENMNPQKIMTSESIKKDEEADLKLVPALQVTDKVSQQEKARIKKLKDAVEIINNAIAEESRRELDLNAVKKVTSAKPPVPSSTDKPRAKSTASSDSSSKSPPLSPTDVPSGKRTIRVQVAPNDVRLATVQVSTPQSTTFAFDKTNVAKPLADTGSETASGKQNASDLSQNEDNSSEHREGDTPEPGDVERSLDTVVPAKKKSAKVEIILKSATLPRRRTSKAEIQLGFPPNSRSQSEAPGEYRTEVEHMVGSTTPRLQTQRSEVAFPVAAATHVRPLSFRSSSLEPEGTPSSKSKPREHIIPIRVERDADESSTVSSPPTAKPSIQGQRSVSDRSNSLSRQSTQDSDTDSTISATGPEPIRKSPREYIIPIAMEGGGYITPRAGSLEPSISEASTEASRLHYRSPGCLSKPRKMSSLLSDGGASEDEGFNSLSSPFATLQKHSSLGKDDADDERPFHRMHRLRSSRPSRRPPLEHNDSLSSAEEDEDDDDGFEILTAESLFTTLLSRVRSLTQRLNVEDAGHPGFPSSRLLSHLAASRNNSPSGFWSNTYSQQGDPLSRRISESSHFSRPFGHDGGGPTSWRRSISRDVSDGESFYGETGGGTLPRGPSRLDSGSISDDAGSDLSSSYYYTPSTARRIQYHRHSSCQDVGSQSTMNQQTPSSDHLVPTRKLSLGSLTSQDSNIPHHISRRLSTLSLQNTTDGRSNSCMSRNHDYHSRNSNILNSKFGVQGRKDSHDNFMLSLHRRDYLSDTDESTRNQTRKDFLAPGRRSLSLLDSKDRDFLSISTHRDSSASDFDDYGHHRKPMGMDKVLPPLPCSAGSHGRRKEAGRSSSIARQRSTNVGGGPYEDDLSGSGHNLNRSTIPEETAYDRPHHSSSLPSVTRTKEKKCFSSCADKMNTEFKTTSNSKVDSSCSASVDPRSISSYSALPSELNISKFGSVNNSSSVLGSMPDVRSKYQDRSFRRSNSNAPSSSEYKGRSQIPSLLHFRSPSVSCEVEKRKKVNIEEGTDSVITPRSTTSSCTPDRSVLSKFFRQGCGEKDRRQQVQPAGEEKDAAKKKRRISRFLRPDFFDTPREESIYAKEKDANKAEDKTKLKLRKNIQRLAGEKNGSLSHVQAVLETGSSSGHSEERLETNLITAFSDSVNTDKDNINPKNSDNETKQMEEKSGEQVKSVSEMEEKSKSMNDAKKTEKSCLTFEKLSNNVNRKSQFLHSLEKKLEKFRSSGDCIPSSSTSGKSRVDKAIRSLREQSLAPRSGDIVTSESHLLKRAVSVSDCYTVESTSKNHLPSTNENSHSKLRNKVTAVLGLFRNLEVTPVKACRSSSVQPSLLSRLRRTQSVYAGSHSDSVLVGPDVDVSGSPDFKTFPPLGLKKISSNSSVVKKKPIARDVKIQKGNLETNKSTETDLQVPGLNTLEHTTTDHSTELTTENTLENETVPCNSNTTQDICVLEGIIATKQQESSVPKLLKRGSIKSNTKNTNEGSSQAQSNNDVSANSDTKIMSVLDLGKCSEEQVSMRSVIQGNTKPDRPTSLTGLKGTIAYKGMKVPKAADVPVMKLEVPTNKGDDVSLVTQEVASDSREMCIPSKVEKSINHLGKNKNNCVKRESSAHMSCKICTDACNGNELGSGTISGVSPTTDAVVANSLADEYSLKEDEIKFANVKHLSLCLFPSADSSLLSPLHELESSDSRSVCSDFENHEFPPSPVSPSGDDAEESVGDRIHRKSFYSRFNDIKRKHRKSSLSSVGSFPLSYQDPNSVSLLHHPRNFLRKKGHSVDYTINTSHSVHLPLKSHRSQSFHAQNYYNDRLSSYARRSPVPYTSQHSSYAEGYVNSLHAENMTSEVSEYVDDVSMTDKNDLWDGSQKASVPVDEAGQTALCAGESMPVLGGSTETLRMPRHFQHNVNQDTLPYQPLYPDTMIRGSDSCFSRSTESSIGTAIPKSHLPTIRDRHSSLVSGFASKSSVGVTGPDSAVHLGSVAGESVPLHGKYNRFNSKSPASVCNGPPKTAGQNHWMESE